MITYLSFIQYKPINFDNYGINFEDYLQAFIKPCIEILCHSSLFHEWNYNLDMSLYQHNIDIKVKNPSYKNNLYNQNGRTSWYLRIVEGIQCFYFQYVLMKYSFGIHPNN